VSCWLRGVRCRNAIRNNLTHPNEYLRGCTLRFVCKMTEAGLLEPLVPVIRDCLGHRHKYVRRNAFLAVYSIAKTHPELFPDAADIVAEHLEKETDEAARRNAFLMLFNCAQDRALDFFMRHSGDSFGDGFNLLLLDLARKACRKDGDQRLKAKFMRPIFTMLDSESPAVSFEAASTLLALSAAPTAVRAAAQALATLLNKEADNNVKLVILERLTALRPRQGRVLRELVMDVMGALSSPAIEVRQKSLELSMELASPRNVKSIVNALRKQLQITREEEATASASGGAGAKTVQQYRRLLVSAIHQCATRFPAVTEGVIVMLMDFLGSEGSARVARFMREMVEAQPVLRPTILSKLCSVFPQIHSPEVLRQALWVLGQYSESAEEVHVAINTIRACIGGLPLDKDPAEIEAASEAPEAIPDDASVTSAATSASKSSRPKPKVLADGTYATQASVGDDIKPSGRFHKNVPKPEDSWPYLRTVVVRGTHAIRADRPNFYAAASVATTLTKLALRSCALHGDASREGKKAVVDTLVVLCAMLEATAKSATDTSGLHDAKDLLGSGSAVTMDNSSSRVLTKPDGSASALGNIRIDQDAFEHIASCMKVLGDDRARRLAQAQLLQGCSAALRGMLEFERAMAAGATSSAPNDADAAATTAEAAADKAAAASSIAAAEAAAAAAHKEAEARITSGLMAHADDAISFRQLRGATAGDGVSAVDLALDDDAEVAVARGQEADDFSSRLKRVKPLTGFSDPVYVEAVVTVRDYDITLEMAIMNRTDRTLTNCTVDLGTVGDLKVVDRPPVFNLGPYETRALRASVKVSSTESGKIFGDVVFDKPGSSDKVIVSLSHINIDVMDYISPAYCDAEAFRKMWAEFEWENRVTVNTNIRSLGDYVAHIVRITNMRCLTPIAALAGSAGFLAANLYARSVFGEDALANVSVENRPDGSIRGHLRIRAKTQGVALALGERITAHQKI
jgi:coatomer subunit beta